MQSVPLYPAINEAELSANLQAPIEENRAGLYHRDPLKQQKITPCHIAGMTKPPLSTPPSTLCQQRACGSVCTHSTSRRRSPSPTEAVSFVSEQLRATKNPDPTDLLTGWKCHSDERCTCSRPTRFIRLLDRILMKGCVCLYSSSARVPSPSLLLAFLCHLLPTRTIKTCPAAARLY